MCIVIYYLGLVSFLLIVSMKIDFYLNIKYRYNWEEGNRRKQGELNKDRWMDEQRKRRVGTMTNSGSRSNNSGRLNKD